MEVKELLPSGSAVVKTTQRPFSEEVALAESTDPDDVLEKMKGEVSYVFSNGRKFRNPK